MQIKSWQIALVGLVISIIIEIVISLYDEITLIGDSFVLIFIGGSIVLLLYNSKLKISAKDKSGSKIGGIFAIIMWIYFNKFFLFGNYSHSIFIIPSLIYILACIYYFWKKE